MFYSQLLNTWVGSDQTHQPPLLSLMLLGSTAKKAFQQIKKSMWSESQEWTKELWCVCCSPPPSTRSPHCYCHWFSQRDLHRAGRGTKEHIREERESDRYRAQITAGRARRRANALMSSGNVCFEIRNISVAAELLSMSFTLDPLKWYICCDITYIPEE